MHQAPPILPYIALLVASEVIETLDRSADDTGLLWSLSGQPLPCLSLMGRPAACPKNTAVHMHKYCVVCIFYALLLTRLWPFCDLVAAYKMSSRIPPLLLFNLSDLLFLLLFFSQKKSPAAGPCLCPRDAEGDAVHKTVMVERRCWPGSNKPGGVARIVKKYTGEISIREPRLALSQKTS